MQSPSTLTHLETAIRLGITPAHLAELRKDHLLADDHWVKKGREIRYTPSGLLAAATILAEQKEPPTPAAAPALDPVDPTVILPENAPPPTLETAEAALGLWVPDPATHTVIATLVVLRSGVHGLRNRRIVEAYALGDDPRRGDPVMRVEVVDNSNFTAGMQIQCRYVSQDLWTHWDVVRNCAARSPRLKGRW